MAQKRQRIDPVQFILDLDPDKFHEELLRRYSNDDEKGDLQRILHNKFLDLQDLLYCDIQRPQSPQVFTDLELRAVPERVEIVAKESGSCNCWTVGTRVYDDVVNLVGFPAGKQICSFLEQGHQFRRVTVENSNELLHEIFEKLVQHDAISDLEVNDGELFLSPVFLERMLRLERLDLQCNNMNVDHAGAINTFLTTADNQLETLHLDGSLEDKDEVRFEIFEGIQNSRFLRHLSIDAVITDGDHLASIWNLHE